MPSVEFKTFWAPAETDIDDIYDYYAEHVSPESAERLLRDIDRAAKRVAGRPFAGAPRPNFEAGLRSIRVAPRIKADTVELVRVLHERRDLAAAFDETDR